MTSSGAPVGRVLDVYLGLGSGETTIAIEPEAAPDDDTVLLLARNTVRSRRAGVVVLEPATSRRVA